MVPDVRTSGDVSIIDLKGRVTHGSGDLEMREMVQHLLDEGKKNFLINLDKVTFMDSAGIGELVACHKRAVEKGGVIKILKPNEMIFDVLVIPKLVTVFETFNDEQDGVHSF